MNVYGMIKTFNYKNSKFKKMFFSREFILFLLIGVVNAMNGVLFAFFYSIYTIPNLAFILGYFTSLIISYMLNSFITFKEKVSIIKYFKFCISYIPNFIIQNIMVFIFYNVIHWNELLVYCLTAAISVPVTFIMIKTFAFKKRNIK